MVDPVAGEQRATADTSHDQGPRLERLHSLELVAVTGSVISHVEELPPNHPGRTRSFQNLSEQTIPQLGRARLILEYEALGLTQKSASGKDRDVVAIESMQRRPSTPLGVVVHRGKVVDDQGAGVNQLDRASGREHAIQRDA